MSEAKDFDNTKCSFENLGAQLLISIELWVSGCTLIVLAIAAGYPLPSRAALGFGYGYLVFCCFGFVVSPRTETIGIFDNDACGFSLNLD